MVFWLSNKPQTALQKGIPLGTLRPVVGNQFSTTQNAQPNMSTVNWPAVGNREQPALKTSAPVSLPSPVASPIAWVNAPTVWSQFSTPQGADQTQVTNMPTQVQNEISTQIQPQAKVSIQSVTDLYADIKSGMPIEELPNYYPEYNGQESMIKDLKADIDAGMPESEIDQYYPELVGGRIDEFNKMSPYEKLMYIPKTDEEAKQMPRWKKLTGNISDETYKKYWVTEEDKAASAGFIAELPAMVANVLSFAAKTSGRPEAEAQAKEWSDRADKIKKETYQSMGTEQWKWGFNEQAAIFAADMLPSLLVPEAKIAQWLGLWADMLKTLPIMEKMITKFPKIASVLDKPMVQKALKGIIASNLWFEVYNITSQWRGMTPLEVAIATPLGAIWSIVASRFAKKVLTEAEQKAIQETPQLADKMLQETLWLTKPQIRKYEAKFGEIPWKTLNDRGLIKGGDETLDDLATRMQQAKTEKATWISQVKATVPVNEDVTAMIERTRNTEIGAAAPSDRAAVTAKWDKMLRDAKEWRLSHQSLEEAKATFERTQTMNYDYKSKASPERVAQNTAIDTKIREFQQEELARNWFDNIKDINKEISKNYSLLDMLSKQVDSVGGLSFPDYVLLASSVIHPQELVLFAGKKLVQSGWFKRNMIKALNIINGRKTITEKVADLIKINKISSEVEFENFIKAGELNKPALPFKGRPEIPEWSAPKMKAQWPMPTPRQIVELPNKQPLVSKPTPDVDSSLSSSSDNSVLWTKGQVEQPKLFWEPKTPPVDVGITSVKGFKDQAIDKLVDQAKLLEAEGKFAQAEILYKQTIEMGQNILKKEFWENILSMEGTLGRYFGETEPTIALKLRTVTDADIDKLVQIGEKNFKQKSFYTAEPITEWQYGIIDKATGLSNEPGIVIRTPNKITLEKAQELDKIFTDLDIAGATILPNGEWIKLYNLTAFNNDYSKFNQQIKDLVQRLSDSESFWVPSGYETNIFRIRHLWVNWWEWLWTYQSRRGSRSLHPTLKKIEVKTPIKVAPKVSRTAVRDADFANMEKYGTNRPTAKDIEVYNRNHPTNGKLLPIKKK